LDTQKRAIVVLSGGQDSTTCLFLAKQQGYEVHAVTFDYGQRHRIELGAARTVGKLAGVESHEVIRLGDNILKSTSPLVSGEKLEQYSDYHSLPGGVEKTFVPMRNQLFLTIAFNRAVWAGAEIIFTGVSQEDFAGYSDCRLPFITRIEDASNCGLFGTARILDSHKKEGWIHINTPLMNLSKKETVYMAYALPGCYEALAYSHTSYDGAYPPVGKDHATLLRAKGFDEAGIPDPLVLRAYLEGRMDLPSSPAYANSGVLRDCSARVRVVMEKVRGPMTAKSIIEQSRR
jgi:7-cyano-7-deazaguanine synthase